MAGAMAAALAEARAAAAREEVPVGAVIVAAATGRILARCGNRTRELNDPTGHAEILAIRAAADLLGNHRLGGHHLFVTLEPCAMCAGAISHARLDRLVFAAADEKMGGVRHGARVFDQPTCHHRPAVEQDAQAAPAAAALLRQFFRERRAQPEPGGNPR